MSNTNEMEITELVNEEELKIDVDVDVEGVEEEGERDESIIHDNQYIFIQMPSGNIKVVKIQKDVYVFF